MDSTFIVISIVFIIFIIIAHFLKVLRLSIPLVMIYIIFCFNYLIDNDDYDNNYPKKINMHNIENPKNYSTTKTNKPFNNNNKTTILKKQTINDIAIPKPIVSYTPKPIMIDSNVNIIDETETNSITSDLIMVDNSNNDENKIKILT